MISWQKHCKQCCKTCFQKHPRRCCISRSTACCAACEAPRAVLHGGHARNTNPCNRQHHRNTRLWARGSRFLPLGTMQWGSSKQAPGFLGNVFGQLSGLGLEASGFVGRVSWRAAELAGTCFDGTGVRACRLV